MFKPHRTLLLQFPPKNNARVLSKNLFQLSESDAGSSVSDFPLHALPPLIDLIVREREKKAKSGDVCAITKTGCTVGGETGGENKCTTSATVEAAVRGEHINRAEERAERASRK